MSDDDAIREALDKDFEEIERKLQNGSAADAILIGRAIALLLRHMRILVRRKTVTDDDCAERMAACPGVKYMVQPCTTPQDALSATAMRMAKDVSPWLLIFVYFVGKGRAWW